MKKRLLLLSALVLISAIAVFAMMQRDVPTQQERAENTADLGLMLLEESGGVSVLAVQEDSLAEQVGIYPTDLLLQVNGTPFTTVEELDKLLNGGVEAVSLCLQRDGTRMEIVLPPWP